MNTSAPLAIYIEDNQLVIFDMKNISRRCVVRHKFFFNALRRILVRYFQIKKYQLIILFIIYLINNIINNVMINTISAL